MIQKGDKVIHLTGDSVIRQGGEGVVIVIHDDGPLYGLITVLWDTEAFLQKPAPNVNHCYTAPVEALAVAPVNLPDEVEVLGNIHEEKVFTPTTRLRWLHVVPEIKMDNGTYVKAPGLIGDRTVLQQYWEDNQGSGEWRDVPTENN